MHIGVSAPSHPPRRADAHPRPRGALKLLVDPAFGGLFWGKMFSVVAVWIHSIVAAIAIYQATGSALMVGLIGVVQFAPQLIGSPTSGKWADTGDPVRQIMLGRVLCVAGSGLVAGWLFVDPGDVVVPVLIGTALSGIGFTVGGPAMQSIVPSLIRPGELSTAMALNSMPMTIGRIAGPPIGAFMVAQLGAVPAFGVSALLHLVFLVILVAVRFPRPQRRDPDADYRVRAALRYVWRDKPLLLALLAVATVGVVSDPTITLTPSLAAELHGGAHLVGVLSMLCGIGSGLAMVGLAVLRGRIPSVWVSSAGLWALTIGSAVLAFAASPAVAAAGYLLSGLGFGLCMTGLSTVVQERAPDELRGRIMALWLVGFLGSRPIAAALLGGAADVVSVQAAFLIAAALGLVVTLACRPATLTGARPA